MIEGTYEKNGEKINIYIFLIQTKSKFEKKTDEFKKLINRLVPYNKNKHSEVIYITEQLSTSYISKKINEYKNESASEATTKFKLDILPYTYENFIIVLPECVFSSIYQIATPDEITQYCNKLLIDIYMLPKIYSNDAQIIWIGGSVGEVVKITSKSETAMEVEEFRLII